MNIANRRKADGTSFRIDDFMRWGRPEQVDEDDVATPEKFSALIRRKVN